MTARPTAHRLRLAGFGVAGLLAGHALGYVVALPDDVHRHALLVQTGHGYLGFAGFLAGVAGVAAGVASLWFGMARGRPSSALRCWVQLGILQAAGFVALEVLERVQAGAPLREAGPLLAVGVVVQILVAAAAAVVLVGIEGAGGAIAAARREPAAGGSIEACAPVSDPGAGSPWVGGSAARAPPAPTVA
jgi:hypothetical protein